jgi:ATP-binding cassette subfamily F protein 3
VLADAPAALPERARAALGALGLTGDDALRPIGQLSGGEKARVVLAGFALRPVNVLLLDEPTNHLDATTVEVLAEALAAFEGAVVLVTHDRWLVERLATHVATVGGGQVEAHVGLRATDLEAPRPERSTAGPSAPPVAFEARKDRKRLERRMEKLSAEADVVSAELGRLHEAMFDAAADRERLAALDAAHRAAEARLEALFEELAELESALAG